MTSVIVIDIMYFYMQYIYIYTHTLLLLLQEEYYNHVSLEVSQVSHYVATNPLSQPCTVFLSRGDLSTKLAGKAGIKDHKSNAGGRVKSTPPSPCSSS